MPQTAEFSPILVPGYFKGSHLMEPEFLAPLPGLGVPREPAARDAAVPAGTRLRHAPPGPAGPRFGCRSRRAGWASWPVPRRR